ncbi:hypothetical protein PGTUg99_024919 [Puccinia graminis f. sp. tritici]|uniref:CCHC-type domain-containing protein n=1 Tax=Puccinia graminis f. sp. tritici TaxID=56615 RepID=A0A5B0R752_PUCGR|nr:hypothetical protein PGTUg99_024919 [Puccinia graminis f. sp. tritici]
MSGYRKIQNVSLLVATIESLEGTVAVFPRWRSCLKDVLGMQNTLDNVKGTLPRPKEESKEATISSRTADSKGEGQAGVKLKSVPYEKNTWARQIRLQEAFWNVCHDPNKPIALWIGCLRVAADDLLSIEELSTDCQIADRLVGGLDPSWSAVRDSVVYPAKEMLLDDTIGALEAHKVGLKGTGQHRLVSAASTKQLACSNCGKHGHQYSKCQKKN